MCQLLFIVDQKQSVDDSECHYVIVDVTASKDQNNSLLRIELNMTRKMFQCDKYWLKVFTSIMQCHKSLVSILMSMMTCWISVLVEFSSVSLCNWQRVFFIAYWLHQRFPIFFFLQTPYSNFQLFFLHIPYEVER